MANLFKLTADVRGNWRRQNLGKKLDETGDIKSVTFNLGRDYAVACQRVVLLDKMWDAIGKDWQRDKETAVPLWSAETHAIALAVARGESPILLDVPAERRHVADQFADGEMFLAVWIGSLKELFPFLDIRLSCQEEQAAAEKASEELAAAMEDRGKVYQETAQRVRGHSSAEMLHTALAAYDKHVGDAYGQDGAGIRRFVSIIKDHIEDQPLSMLTSDKILALLRYWRERPASKKPQKRNKPLAYATCRGIMMRFRAFLNWLNQSEAFRWELPRTFRFPRQRIKKFPAERVQKRKHFKISELKIIWEHCFPWERAILLLGLNCGFARAELAEVLKSEVVKDKKGNTFIKRIRGKSEVYAEWLLWPETIQGIELLKSAYTVESEFLVCGTEGRPIPRLTAGGNDNQKIKNHWDRIMRRVMKAQPDFNRLPFKHVRKTGIKLVHWVSKRRGTELASMFASHGQRADAKDQVLPAYTDRPWHKLHKVLALIRKKLLAVFESVPEPWACRRVNRGLTQAIKDEMIALRTKGKTYVEIASATGFHHVTVYKVCKGVKKKWKKGQ